MPPFTKADAFLESIENGLNGTCFEEPKLVDMTEILAKATKDIKIINKTGETLFLYLEGQTTFFDTRTRRILKSECGLPHLILEGSREPADILIANSHTPFVPSNPLFTAREVFTSHDPFPEEGDLIVVSHKYYQAVKYSGENTNRLAVVGQPVYSSIDTDFINPAGYIGLVVDCC